MENSRISHYEVGRFLGRGGMGEVYEAVDVDLGRRVALKFVAPELSASAEAVRRFEREARAAAALHHPHIATLFAFERHGPRPFLAMELVGGESLRERISGGPLPIPEALAIGRDVAAALAFAHRHGIVHRDVKPENLMFDLDGAVKVMDFGLARAAQSSRLTTTGTSLGTAAYMAPEAMRAAAEAPADVFALGVVLHEMLTGALPFHGDNPLALLYAIANEEPRSTRALRPEISETVEALIASMLRKEPGQRPDAGQVARELAALTHAPPPRTGDTQELEAARLREGAADVGEATAGTATPALPPGPRPRTSLRPLGILLGGGAIIATLVAGTLIERGRRQRHQDAIAFNNRGIEALRRGSADSALASFRAALARDPANGQAMLNLGSLLRRQGERPRAESLYSAVLRRHRNDPRLLAQAHYNLGSMDLDDGAWESAVENLEKSFRLDSSSARAYNNYGLALVRAGRAREAQAVLERGLRRFPAEAMLSKNAGLAAYSLGDAPASLRHLDAALARDPGLAAARGLRACALARMEMQAEAKREWLAFLAMAPEPAERQEIERELTLRGALP